MKSLPSIETADDEKALPLINTKKLMGRGIGWIDVNLLTTYLIKGIPLWTGEKNLRAISLALGLWY